MGDEEGTPKARAVRMAARVQSSEGTAVKAELCTRNVHAGSLT